MAKEMRKPDVKDVAEDNKKLMENYELETGYKDGELEGWLTPSPALVRGPYNHTTAIIIKLKSGDGDVSLLLGEERVCAYSTHPNAPSEVIMVFLKPEYYCWWVGGAEVKYIKRLEGTS